MAHIPPQGRPVLTQGEALAAIVARLQGVFDDATLVKFGPLSDRMSDVLEIAACCAPATTAYVGVVDHRHGLNVYVAATESDCRAKVAAYCRFWAEREAVTIPAGASDDSAIEVYFCRVDDESVTFSTDEWEG